MENREFADQLPDDGFDRQSRDCPSAPERLDHPALRLIRARPDLFSRQGHVAATWRRRNGKTFGPYYRLGYREGGRQFSVYLGRSGELAEQVRRAIEAVQMPLAQRRLFNSIERQIRASLRVHKHRVSALLRPYGLRLKGFEVRGWRYSPLRYLLPRRGLTPRVVPRRPPPLRRQTSTPAEKLLRFLDARDGPRVLAQ